MERSSLFIKSRTRANELEVPKYSRIVSRKEIEGNEFNLNIPRYIDSYEPEDIQDIEGHLKGGIPVVDVDALERYWKVCPDLRSKLFSELRPGYLRLNVDKAAIRKTIHEHSEFKKFNADMEKVFKGWRDRSIAQLKALEMGFKPKEIILTLSESILRHYAGKSLINNYEIYQHLMDYWTSTMQDDCYIISDEGWKAETYRVLVKNNKGLEVDKGWTCDLVPKYLIVNRYFTQEQKAITELEAEVERLAVQLSKLEEEHGHEEGALSSVSKKTEAMAAWHETLISVWETSEPETYQQYTEGLSHLETQKKRLLELGETPELQAQKNKRGKITQNNINSRLKKDLEDQERDLLEEYKKVATEIRKLKSKMKKLLEGANDRIEEDLKSDQADEDLDELRVLQRYLSLNDEISGKKKDLKAAEAELDEKVLNKYPALTEEEIKGLVVDDKWMAALTNAIHREIDRIGQILTNRVKELAERYGTPLPRQVKNVAELEETVNEHLRRMGYSW